MHVRILFFCYGVLKLCTADSMRCSISMLFHFFFFYNFIVDVDKSIFPDQREVYEVESIRNSNRSIHAHGHGHLKRKPRTPSVRVPSVNVICEVNDGQMFRSQSVGHSMATNTSEANKLLNITHQTNGGTGGGGQENDIKPIQNGTKTDGMRYTLSQPLLINTASEHEYKPLKESHKHWRSGTLSRPDIFYQVRNGSRIFTKLRIVANKIKCVVFFIFLSRDHFVTFLTIDHTASFQLIQKHTVHCVV